MSVLKLRYAVLVYLVFFLAVTTWPGATIFNHVKPLVLGLPFNLFFLAVIIIGALCLLAALYRAEDRARED